MIQIIKKNMQDSLRLTLDLKKVKIEAYFRNSVPQYKNSAEECVCIKLPSYICNTKRKMNCQLCVCGMKVPIFECMNWCKKKRNPPEHLPGKY